MRFLTKPVTRRLVIAAAAIAACVAATAFLNYRSDDEIYIGAENYDSIPGYADDNGGVITVDDGMGAEPGSVIAEIPAIHVDAGSFVLDVDHQNDEDIDVEILDGERVIASASLPQGESNTRISFHTDDNAYNLKARFTYGGEGQAVLKRSILYSVGGAFYSDTLIYAVFIIAAVCVLVYLMIRWDFFSMPLGDRICFGAAALYLLLVNYMYYRPFPIGAEDVGFHLARIEATYNEIRQGQIPVIMYSDFVQGRGMIGIMYPSLFLLLPAALRVLHMSPEGALRMFFIIVSCATCASSYYASKKLIMDKYLATTSMMLYGMLLYRITTMTYRYAYGELQAFIFFPLVICGLYETVLGDRKKWTVLAIGMTGLMQCHLLSFIQAALICLIVGVLNLTGIIREKRYIRILLAVVTTLLLNLWYIVPFLTYYREDLATKEHLSWGSEIYVFSSYLTEMLRLFPNTSEGETQHKMGLVGIWLVILAAAAIYIQIRKQERTCRDRFSLILMIIGAVSLFMASKAFPWETAVKFEAVSDVMGYMQFVGRFYLIGEICLFFGAVITISGTARSGQPAVRAALLAAVAIAALQAYSVSDSWLSEYTDPFSDARAERYTAAVNDTTVEDYVPGGYWFGEGFAGEPYSPEADITGYSHQHLHTSFDYTSREATYAEIPILYYRGYRASTDDDIPLRLSKGTAGCIRIELPENGKTTVNVEFTGFAVWKISLIISVLAAMIFFGVIIYGRKRH